MSKRFSFRSAMFAAAMLLLCGTFLQSCTEEMPILAPLNGTTNNSKIVLNVNNATYTLTNKNPGYVFFAPITVGTGSSSNIQYNVNGSNGLQTNAVDFIIDFGLNANNKYVLVGSQLNLNNKSYTTVYNNTGKAQLTINKIDTIANATSGSYAYYLYDSAFTPTDSIYVNGTFNIVK